MLEIVLALTRRTGHYALVTELGDLHRRKAKLKLVGLILAVIVASLVFWRFGMYSL